MSQTLSRADTETLRSGVCPACSKTRWLINPSFFYHMEGAYRRVLCLNCFREFGLRPHDVGDGLAIIIWYVTPDRRLASDYKIFTGSISRSGDEGASQLCYPEPNKSS